MRHRARRVEAGEFSPVELAGGDTVVDVAELRKPWWIAMVPAANTRSGRGLPRNQRARSMSCTVQSRKMPPLVGAKRTKNPDGSFRSRFCERTRNGAPIRPAWTLS
jgi:hypothetical protein